MSRKRTPLLLALVALGIGGIVSGGAHLARTLSQDEIVDLDATRDRIADEDECDNEMKALLAQQLHVALSKGDCDHAGHEANDARWLAEARAEDLACRRRAGHDHAHHGKGMAHRDPGPRRMTAAELEADQAASLAYIGPETSLGEPMTDPSGREGLLLVSGGVLYGNLESAKRVVPWAMSPVESSIERPALSQALSESSDHDLHHDCAARIYDVKYGGDPTPLTEKIAWNLLIHLTARDGRVVVDDVVHHEPPTRVNQEVQDCYARAFRGASFEAAEGDPQDESMWVTWSVCINPPHRRAASDAVGEDKTL